MDEVIKRLELIKSEIKRVRNGTIDEFIQKISEEMPYDICDGVEALYYIKEIADKMKEG